MSMFGSHVGRMGAEPAGLGARGTLRRVKALWAYNWPYRSRSAVALMMMLAATATAIAGPLAIKAAAISRTMSHVIHIVAGAGPV